MQVYIQAKSKAAINRDLKEGKPVTAMEYGFAVTHHEFKDLPDGTVVKVFEKVIGGNPYAKAYGQVKNGKVS
jgi:hypothetical protein